MLCNKNCMLWKNFHTLSNSDPPSLQPRKKGLSNDKADDNKAGDNKAGDDKAGKDKVCKNET